MAHLIIFISWLAFTLPGFWLDWSSKRGSRREVKAHVLFLVANVALFAGDEVIGDQWGWFFLGAAGYWSWTLLPGPRERRRIQGRAGRRKLEPDKDGYIVVPKWDR
jgi:hypothetical protein